MRMTDINPRPGQRAVCRRCKTWHPLTDEGGTPAVPFKADLDVVPVAPLYCAPCANALESGGAA